MRKVVVAVVAGLAAAGLWWSGWLGQLAQPAAIQATVASAGVWGPLIYMLLAIGLFAVFLLAPPVWASAALWPLPLAFTYSYIAAVAASAITFFAMRRFGREWASRRIPPKIQRWEERLRQRPFLTVITLRLLLWANPLIDMLAAITGIAPRSYLLATFAGLVLPTGFHVSIGAGGMAAAAKAPAWIWAAVLAMALVVAAIYRLRSGRVIASGSTH